MRQVICTKTRNPLKFETIYGWHFNVLLEGKRFMSAATECAWYGVECDDQDSVIKINVGIYFYRCWSMSQLPMKHFSWHQNRWYGIWLTCNFLFNDITMFLLFWGSLPYYSWQWIDWLGSRRVGLARSTILVALYLLSLRSWRVKFLLSENKIEGPIPLGFYQIYSTSLNCTLRSCTYTVRCTWYTTKAMYSTYVHHANPSCFCSRYTCRLQKKLTSILRCRFVHHALLRTVDPRAWHTRVCGAM
jgi:hypothetical protein